MKKLSATKQILNFLNTYGSSNVKNLISELELPATNIYAGLSYLRKNKHITRDASGIYRAKTKLMPLYNEKAVSNNTNNTNNFKTLLVSTSDKPIKDTYTKNLEKENLQLTEWTQMWKRKYDVLDRDYTQAKVMYLDSQAVVAYLEEKVAQLIRGQEK